MTPPPWMLLRLALETAAHHAPADEDRLAVMDLKNLDDYRTSLIRIYGLEAPVERAIAAHKDLHPAFIQERSRVPHLRADMIVSGIRAHQLATLPQATITIASPAHALGWLFVLERNMLLGGVVARHVQRTLGMRVRGATRYFESYGQGPGAKFRELGNALCMFAQRYSPNMIVAGAHDAFRQQRQWYRGGASTTTTTTAQPRRDVVLSSPRDERDERAPGDSRAIARVGGR